MGLKVCLSHWGRNIDWRYWRIGCWGRFLCLEKRGNSWVEKTTERGAFWSVFLTRHHSDDKIKKNEMRLTCSMHGEGRITYGVLWGGVRKRNHLEDLDVDERVILKRDHDLMIFLCTATDYFGIYNHIFRHRRADNSMISCLIFWCARGDQTRYFHKFWLLCSSRLDISPFILLPKQM